MIIVNITISIIFFIISFIHSIELLSPHTRFYLSTKYFNGCFAAVKKHPGISVLQHFFGHFALIEAIRVKDFLMGDYSM